MELPQPPQEQELKNIIDKLAQFVARNGPEFEHMTKQKQKDNPKFSFLFGGAYFHYYQYKVTTEQAILKQKQRSLEQQQALVQQALNRQSIQAAPWQQQMQDSSQEQIRQSEQNLAAQHQLLLQQQQVQVDEVIRKAQEDKLISLAAENDLDLKELNGILQPIIDSCTKDSISGGKGWIFNHSTSYARSEVIFLFVLKRVTEPGASFEAKLHLVYLVNDVLHHCFRKNADDLKKILEKVVVPIFCSTSIGVDADRQQKLSKLYKLWESNKYFSKEILDQLQNPAASLAAYQAGLIAEHAALITPITTAIQTQYALLQKQHQDFVAHLTGQMHQMQIPVPYAFQSIPGGMAQPAVAPAPYMPHNPYDQQNVSQVAMDPCVPIVQVADEVPKAAAAEFDASQPILEAQHSEIKDVESQEETEPMHINDRMNDMRNPDMMHDCEPLPPMRGSRDHAYPPDDMMDPYDYPMERRHSNGRPPMPPHYMDEYPPTRGYGGRPYEEDEYRHTPPHMGYDHPMSYRDGPMGLGPPDMAPDYMEPSIPPHLPPPYYDLPAGLMVPLVALEDTDYNNFLDPSEVRLPAPAMPTDRLIAAVEQFYCPPTHERTRNNSYVISSEGWEQLGLYEFFKAKAIAKKQKGLSNEERDYDRTMTSMDLPRFHTNEPKIQEKQRRYREIKSPEPEANISVKNGEKEVHRRHSRSQSRSQSGSPENTPRRESRSPTPPQRSNFQRSRGRSRSRTPPNKRRSPDRKRSPDDRSPNRRSVSPPSFMGSGSHPHDRRLDESNKGHQLLKKMGWSGAGLGATEQGIQDPVDAGDVRDRQDMYKGIGVSLNDPYENFRKSKGQAFINRMKARAEELGKM